MITLGIILLGIWFVFCVTVSTKCIISYKKANKKLRKAKKKEKKARRKKKK